MSLKNKSIIFSIAFISSLLCACEANEEPISAVNNTFETSSGVITQIEDYPIFTIYYSSDYKFDDYLQTGSIPLDGASSFNGENFSCTCYSASGEDSKILGRNYDWPELSTYFIVITNPTNGYSSISTVDLSFFSYAHDKSPDFSGNQSTIRRLPYYPFDGMNEKGVSVGMNAVNEMRSPYDPSKITIGELQLIRLVLDYASSTTEAIELIQEYNIQMEDPPIHYLIADSTGYSVIIEFVDEKLEIIETNNSWQVTTNFVITGLKDPKFANCWRFNTANETLDINNGMLSETDAFNLLQNVSVNTTRWSVVYYLKSRQSQITFNRDYENIHYFSLY